jgi:glycosyltransferase involved in cell wall biosynthesis
MKRDFPRFSILLPAHNRADVLGFAIASVLEQSETDFELLIVADGCTDGTADVVASFADPRIRFFDLPKAPHLGYANRNVVLRQARGHLVAYAAHDDLMLPDHLALLGNLLEQNGAAWCYSRPLWVSTDGVIVPFCTNLGLADELRAFLQDRNTIPTSCVAHSRAALEQVGFWPEDVPFAADWVLWRRMITRGGSAAYFRQPTNLHFSANWKQSRFSGISEVKVLLEIADNASWWPSILRNTSAAEPEQATIWRAIKIGGDPWVKNLREATEAVIDRIAWMAVRDLHPGIETALAAQARSEAVAETALAAQARSEAVAETLRAEVEALRASTSWRITAPLRNIARRLRSQRHVTW